MFQTRVAQIDWRRRRDSVYETGSVCVCLFLYLLYAENQNTHSSSKVRIFVNCWGLKGAFKVVVRIGSGSGGQGVLD